MISAKPNNPIATLTIPRPSVSSGNAEVEARDAGVDVGADDAEQQAEHDHRDRLQQRAVGEHDGADQAEHHQRKIFGRPELERELRQRNGTVATKTVATLPAKNEPSAAIASAAPAWPLRAIWWPSRQVTADESRRAC